MITLIFLAYAFVIITAFALNYFPQHKETSWGLKISMLADYSLNPIRKIMPADIPFDASFLVVLILLLILRTLFHLLIIIYTLVIIADVVLSFFPQYRYENWTQTIKRFSDFSLDPIRKILPQDLPFDFSPMIVIIILQLLTTLA